MKEWIEIAPIKASFEMPQLQRPIFPDRPIKIIDYGAKGDGIPSLPGYYYAVRDNHLYVNLYASATDKVKMARRDVTVTQKTHYPWDGKVNIGVDLKENARFILCLRIPGWARNEVMHGDPYQFEKTHDEKVTIKVNGTKVDYSLQKGFASIDRRWKKGDTVELDLPMPVRRVLCHPNVKDNVGRVAIQRGPVVYCAEGIDNADHVFNLLLGDNAEFTESFEKDLLGGIVTITGKGRAYSRLENSSVIHKAQTIKLIPYYAWNHRGAGEMAVWLARQQGGPNVDEFLLSSGSIETPDLKLPQCGSDSIPRLDPGAFHPLPCKIPWQHRFRRKRPMSPPMGNCRHCRQVQS